MWEPPVGKDLFQASLSEIEEAWESGVADLWALGIVMDLGMSELLGSTAFVLGCTLPQGMSGCGLLGVTEGLDC